MGDVRVDGWADVKSLNLYLIKIIQFWAFWKFFGHFYFNHLSPLQSFTVYFVGLQRLEGLPSFVMHG